MEKKLSEFNAAADEKLLELIDLCEAKRKGKHNTPLDAPDRQTFADALELLQLEWVWSAHKPRTWSPGRLPSLVIWLQMV